MDDIPSFSTTKVGLYTGKLNRGNPKNIAGIY